MNNAGISTEGAKLGDSETARFQEMIQTNVLGVYFGMKFQIRQMLKNGGGSIVNLASIAGLNGIPYTSAYCASKHAVVGLTKAGALDYANDGIRINAVAPGAAKTEIIVKAMTQGVYDEASISAMHPMNRMGTAQEIVNGIVWLLSDEASFVTGHILNIDGWLPSQMTKTATPNHALQRTRPSHHCCNRRVSWAGSMSTEIASGDIIRYSANLILAATT